MHGGIAPRPKSGRRTKLTKHVLQTIENTMNNDDETTATELVAAVNRLHPGTSISTTTALKGRRSLGWT